MPFDKLQRSQTAPGLTDASAHSSKVARPHLCFVFIYTATSVRHHTTKDVEQSSKGRTAPPLLGLAPHKNPLLYC